MTHHELDKNGLLAIFNYYHHGTPVVTASGYVLKEAGEDRLYLVSLQEERLSPPRKLVHVALAKFAREVGASHLVPVHHAMENTPGHILKARLSHGFLPVHDPVSLQHLELKLARARRPSQKLTNK